MSGVARAESDQPGKITAVVFEEVKRVAPEGLLSNLSLETNLFEAGLDSLQQMEVINALEKSFDLRFKEEWLYDIETCSDLIQLIETQLSGKADEVTLPSSNQPRLSTTIDEGCYDIEQFPECVAFHERIDSATAMGFELPFLRINDATNGSSSTVAGQSVVRYTSFNYLGCANAPSVVAAAMDAIQRFGASASASRLVGGNHCIAEKLDAAIAKFTGAEAAAVFPSGYGTNASVISHLFDKDDLIVYDELSHNSMVAGIKASGASHRAFPHNDSQYVDQLLADVRSRHRRVLIVVEGVYSMDGDYPNLPEFVNVKKRHAALLYVDEAHSIGVMGATGRGMAEHFAIEPNEVDIWMGTISKALGSGGGYIAGRNRIVKYLKYTAPSFVFATGISPANAAAALAALQLIENEPQRVTTLRERSRLFLELAKKAGLDTGGSSDTPIIPVIIGDSLRCVRLSKALLDMGIDAQPILYPAVPEKASRLRFFITADHQEDQIRRTVDILASCMQNN